MAPWVGVHATHASVWPCGIGLRTPLFLCGPLRWFGWSQRLQSFNPPPCLAVKAFNTILWPFTWGSALSHFSLTIAPKLDGQVSCVQLVDTVVFDSRPGDPSTAEEGKCPPLAMLLVVQRLLGVAGPDGVAEDSLYVALWSSCFGAGLPCPGGACLFAPAAGLSFGLEGLQPGGCGGYPRPRRGG